MPAAGRLFSPDRRYAFCSPVWRIWHSLDLVRCMSRARARDAVAPWWTWN